jgi:hypothetical protein
VCGGGGEGVGLPPLPPPPPPTPELEVRMHDQTTGPGRLYIHREALLEVTTPGTLQRAMSRDDERIGIAIAGTSVVATRTEWREYIAELRRDGSSPLADRLAMALDAAR